MFHEAKEHEEGRRRTNSEGGKEATREGAPRKSGSIDRNRKLIKDSRVKFVKR
jgi:hypothetical protein